MAVLQRLLNGLSRHSSHHKAPSEPMAHIASSSHDIAVPTFAALAGKPGASPLGALTPDAGAILRAGMKW